MKNQEILERALGVGASDRGAPEKTREYAAAFAFVAICVGIGMLSVPWMLIVGGGLTYSTVFLGYIIKRSPK